jgi:hypothetical protein
MLAISRSLLPHLVIPNAARNHSAVLANRKRESSARGGPRNDGNFHFAANGEVVPYQDQENMRGIQSGA